MNLKELLNSVSFVKEFGNSKDLEIGDITFDSREVNDFTLFFAVKGFVTDGHTYIQDAINKGCKAVVLDNQEFIPETESEDAVYILVKNSRKSLAEFSHFFYGQPSTKINLIGITGTKGKTTTSYYLRNIFTEAGYKSGLMGTNINIVDQREVESHLTTPQSHEVNRLLAEMVEAGCEYCVMEISSHSLALHRVDYLDFDCAIFTNLTSDHMDFHTDHEDYLKTKKMLFDNLKENSIAIINMDDKSAPRMVDDTAASISTYGTCDSDFKLDNITYDFDGTKFNIITDKLNLDMRTKSVGKFNAYNAVAAYAAADRLGFEQETIEKAIKNNPQIKGRFEIVKVDKRRAIIDFSHTSDSLKQTLIAINEIADSMDVRPEIITVFGCGGDKDKTKRPIMGGHASFLSDKVIVTSDNPRDEDPYDIINDILPGLVGNKYKVIEDRELAIKTAVEEASENCVILLAGKGHEETQLVKGVETHFSDKELVEKYLELCRN